MSKMSEFSVQDSISGNSFLAIQRAMKVLDAHKIDLSAYTVVVKVDDYVLLLANNGNKRGDGTKNFGVGQGSDVEMADHEVSVTASKLGQAKQLEKIGGRSFLAMRTGAEVFLQRDNADLRRYIIEVVSDENKLVVTFTAKDKKPGTRGSGVPGTPGFEVELNPQHLTVLDAYFVR